MTTLFKAVALVMLSVLLGLMLATVLDFMFSVYGVERVAVFMVLVTAGLAVVCLVRGD